MVTPTSFKLRFPEFDAVLDDRVQMIIDESKTILNETYWDNKYDMGINYLTAHDLYVNDRSEVGDIGNSGAITGRSVDGSSVSYASATPKNSAEAYYSTTSYGRKYLSLLKTLGIAAVVI